MIDPWTLRGFFQWVTIGFTLGAGWTIAENVLAIIGKAIAAMLQ